MTSAPAWLSFLIASPITEKSAARMEGAILICIYLTSKNYFLFLSLQLPRFIYCFIVAVLVL
jgi:hypothetical protein